MRKINILFADTSFKEDLAQQIQLFSPQTEVVFETPDTKTDLIFVDDNTETLKRVASEWKETPVIAFSENVETSEFADLVIKKPFRLEVFLQSLKNKTLLPKVRRKECLNFKEYSLYPVKKEIISSLNGKTIKLTEKEIEIIKYLYQNFPQISDKEELLENVWKYSSDATTHTVETHIYRLRQKVEQKGSSQLIITENNGYRLNM